MTAYRVAHARNCPDRDGCPFDARRCACWRMGCRIVEERELDDDGVPVERTVPGGFARASQDDL